jgi:hypothetical protein
MELFFQQYGIIPQKRKNAVVRNVLGGSVTFLPQ